MTQKRTLSRFFSQKSLYNRELAKYKAEQSKKNYELLEQNKVYKDHVDELRNQLWDLGEKLLQEQKLKRDLEQTVEQIKKKLTSVTYNEFESVISLTFFFTNFSELTAY